MHSFGWVWKTISGQFIHSKPLCFKLLLSKVKFHAIFSVGMSDNPANQRSQLNLFQNESSCTSFHMEMRFWLFLHVHCPANVTLSFWKVVHQDSFWNRRKTKLRNGLLPKLQKFYWTYYVILYGSSLSFLLIVHAQSVAIATWRDPRKCRLHSRFYVMFISVLLRAFVSRNDRF